MVGDICCEFQEVNQNFRPEIFFFSTSALRTAPTGDRQYAPQVCLSGELYLCSLTEENTTVSKRGRLRVVPGASSGTTEIIKSFASDFIRCFIQFTTDPVRAGLAPVSYRSYLSTTPYLRGPWCSRSLHWHPRTAEENLGATEHRCCPGVCRSIAFERSGPAKARQERGVYSDPFAHQVKSSAMHNPL